MWRVLINSVISAVVASPAPEEISDTSRNWPDPAYTSSEISAAHTQL